MNPRCRYLRKPVYIYLKEGKIPLFLNFFVQKLCQIFYFNVEVSVPMLLSLREACLHKRSIIEVIPQGSCGN